MIFGAGFAFMAWRLARRRVRASQDNWQQRAPHAPLSRRVASIHRSTASWEYYRIIDKAARGWAGLEAARKVGMLGDRPTVVL